MWCLEHRGDPLDVLSGNAKGSIVPARVIGLGEDQLTVMGSKCLKVDVEGGSTGSVIIRLSSCVQNSSQSAKFASFCCL